MPYITEEDYRPYIRSDKLNQIMSPDNPSFRLEAEETAIVIVKDALHTRYDVPAIFALEGTNRHRQVVRWVVVLALYFFYQRIPDTMVPDRVIKDYDDVQATLLDIEDGKKSVDLPRKVDAEAAPITKFRWGSENRREHDV